MTSGMTLKKQNACLHAVRHAVETKIACIHGLRSEGFNKNKKEYGPQFGSLRDATRNGSDRGNVSFEFSIMCTPSKEVTDNGKIERLTPSSMSFLITTL